ARFRLEAPPVDRRAHGGDVQVVEGGKELVAVHLGVEPPGVRGDTVDHRVAGLRGGAGVILSAGWRRQQRKEDRDHEDQPEQPQPGTRERHANSPHDSYAYWSAEILPSAGG